MSKLRYTYFFYKGHVYKGQNDEYWEFRKNKGQSVLNFLDVKGQAVGEKSMGLIQ